MGYAATVGSFKKSLTEQTLICDISYASHTGDLDYSEIFRKNMYWNNTTAIDIGYYCGETGGNTVTMQILKNGVVVGTLPVTSAGAYVYARAVAIAAALQDYGLMVIQIKTDNAPTTAFIRDLKIMSRD